MNQYVDRPTIVCEVPLSADLTVLKPEQVIVRFENRATIDLGQLCYLQREEATTAGHHRKSTKGRKVVLSSLCSRRAPQVRALIDYISAELSHGSRRLATTQGHLRKFLSFMSWADMNGHADAIDSAVSTRRVVGLYTAHIRERVQSQSLSLNTGAQMQKATIAILSDFLGIENLARGLNLLFKDANATTSTTPPSEDDQGRVGALCEALFDGLSSHVIANNPYPFAVAMPSYLGYPENMMWVFPTVAWSLPAAQQSVRGSSVPLGAGYNYQAGRLATREEILVLDKYKCEGKQDIKIVNQMLTQTKLQMERANADAYHPQRLYLGLLALNVFIPLFLSRTGMNWAQVVSLQWSGSCSDNSSTIRQKFRAIKFRAGNRDVHYQLPLNFMTRFKKFLLIRDYLLHDHPDFDKLFFTKGHHASAAPSKITGNLNSTFNALKRIDPGLSPVLSRAWRAAKSDWLITRTDVSTTAQLLQNAERTVRHSYAAGSVETHLAEMSTFLDKMIISKGVQPEGVQASAVGACVSYGNPQPVAADVLVVAPNCQNPEVGCLFCDKFKVHADEQDVRKLLSCRYCLTRTSHLAGFHALSAPLIDRIQLILDEIHRRDDSLVARITKEVEDGELDAYWASKYDMLLRLRLVNDSE